jgi:hypothetical protein
MAAAAEKCHISGTDKVEFMALIESLRQHVVEKDAAKQ